MGTDFRKWRPKKKKKKKKKKKNKTTLAGMPSSVGSAGQSQECVALTFESGNQKKKKKKTRPLWLGCHQVSGPQAKVRNVWHRLSKVATPKKKSRMCGTNFQK